MISSPGAALSREKLGLFVGLTTVDLTFGYRVYPGEDTKNTALRYASSAGGPATNAAVVFSYLGGRSQLWSSLGQSGVSAVARVDLARYDIQHLDFAEDRYQEPALSTIIVAERTGSRTILTSPAIDSDLRRPPAHDDIHEILKSTDIVLLDGHIPTLAESVAREAKIRGIPVVLDGDLYGTHIDKLLTTVDIVIFGKSFHVPGLAHTNELIDYFESRGVKHVISTNGDREIIWKSSGVEGCTNVEKVIVKDTLAAGDFFHGAFCYAFSKRGDLTRATEFAAKVATKSVTQFGTRKWMSDNERFVFE